MHHIVGLISKPHLVDLLRIFDKNKWIIPRIRYASVRSKPELIADITSHFRAQQTKAEVLMFFPKRKLAGVPKIAYDLPSRKYLMDDLVVDVPKESRKKPQFSISHDPVTLTWSEFFSAPEATQTQPSTRRASVSSAGSQGLGTRSPPSDSERSEPSSPSVCTPKSKPSCRFAWEERTPRDSPTPVGLVLGDSCS